MLTGAGTCSARTPIRSPSSSCGPGSPAASASTSMTRPTRRRTGSSAPATPRRSPPPSGQRGRASSVQVAADLFGELEGGPAVEERRDDGTRQQGPERRQVPPEATHQTVAQLVPGGRTEDGGDAAAWDEQVHPSPPSPCLQQAESPLGHAAPHGLPVELLQLTDQLQLDRDHGH